MSSLKVSLFFSRIPLTSYKTYPNKQVFHQKTKMSLNTSSRLKQGDRFYVSHLPSVMFDPKLMFSESGLDIIWICL